ncbi:MAG: response regulator transcription factor [Mycobacterium leprae]
MAATLLLVEDDQDLAFGVRIALEREGWEVHCAENGRVGLQQALAIQPDVLILDVGLPELDGFALCRELRRSSSVPILFLTARSDELDRVLGLELGGDDYLTKPFSLRELIARVRALHRRASGQVQSEERSIRVHDLVLYPERRKVLRGGQEVYLTNTEFNILLQLARRPGKVFSREQLLEAVWEGNGQFVVDHVVNVHLRNLREKLEADPNRPTLVLTVRGAGYKLREVQG